MIQRNLPEAGPRLGDEPGDVSALAEYLAALMSGFRSAGAPAGEPVRAEMVPERVFEVLSSRDFCYLSKRRIAAYRKGILELIREAVRQAEPIGFYYDIGGGYHASTQPGEEALGFDVELAELFVLRQVASFSARVRHLYPPGVKFSLVIDNMCALLVNDIPLTKTLRYCGKLRELIRAVGLDADVDLLVESEHISVGDFARLRVESADRRGPGVLTRRQHDNVERFLGRPCDEREAFERALRYGEVIDASDRLLAALIPGVHMTQRAGETTICFRPFPGGDSRIQCGEVALTRNSKQKLCPVLLTSTNVKEYSSSRYRFPDLLPPIIPHVTYVERASG